MFYKAKSELRFFLLVATSYFYMLKFCCSVSLGQARDASTTDRVQRSEASTKWERTEQDEQRQQFLFEQATTSLLYPHKSSLLGPPELQPDFTSPVERLQNFSEPKLDQSGSNFTFNSLSWIVGNVRTETKPAVPDSEDGYQADFTGFPEIKGQILGISSDSSPYFSQWEAMKPLVECGDNAMIFTASGYGLVHLQVNRNGGSPLSIFHLPPYCGYSVKTSWIDLEMMVPFSGCYMTQENGSYVLPLWWLGNLLKLSCPSKMPTAPPLLLSSSPLVFCSPYGMAVQIQGQQHDLPQLGVIVNGAWGPFVSELCAFQVDSQPQEHTFLVAHSAPCITAEDGLKLQLTLDNQEYVLSCPVIPQFPYARSPPPAPPSRSDPQFPYIPDPANPKPVSPLSQASQTQNQEHNAQLPNYHHYYPYIDLQDSQLYPPPESLSPPQSTVAGSPGSQQQQFQYHMESGQMSFLFGQHMPYLPPHYHYPVNDKFSHQVPKLPLDPYQYPFFFYYPHLSFNYMSSNPTVLENPNPQSNYPEYYPQMPYHPEPTAAPVTQVPAPHPTAPPKEPKDPQHQTGSLYPPLYYPHQPFSHPASHPVASLHSPAAAITDGASYSFSQFYAQNPFEPPVRPPSAGEDTQKPQGICVPSSDSTCHQFSYPYYPHHPFYPQHYYPPLPHYPNAPMKKVPLHLQCLKGRMFVLLPHADPKSIQVRDHQNKWELLSSASSHCGYVLEGTAGHGVIVHSPLPACHSHIQTPTTISLHIRYLDRSIWQNRTEVLQCPYQGVAVTPAPPVPSASPTPPRGIHGKISPSTDLKAEVFCSFQQMNVVLPPGPISEMVVKDIKGNQMNQIKSAEDCGYYASKGKDGKIYVISQLHSHCPMNVQGDMYIISIIYMTESGRKEAQFSCPVIIPRTGHECNLQSEYRLPCGSSSISQTQCLSMGCCFNKHPPACYYAMDECTIDRQMIFSVPASLTNPPLSPALLVAANNATCKPQKATSEYALFKIPMDGCGTRRVMVGKMVVYVVEITNVIQAVSLNYGTITRDSPVRLLVECRYEPGMSLTVSYLVKTPTFGPDVHSQGVLGVQLRIAKDAQYSSYYPQYHQPLHMLLGKPLHLEVRLLNSPDPSLVLLVHFCVAYPRSGKAVWVLLYNGCPNPLDPVPPKTVLSKPQPPTPQSQTRRFTIHTFQFLPDGEFKDMDEEIYFMCSTEICSPHDGPCVEGCFGH